MNFLPVKRNTFKGIAVVRLIIGVLVRFCKEHLAMLQTPPTEDIPYGYYTTTKLER